MKKVLTLLVMVFGFLTVAACAKVREETPSINARNTIVINDGDEFDPVKSFIDDEETAAIASTNLHRSKVVDGKWAGGPGEFQYTITITEGTNSAYQSVKVIVNDSKGNAVDAPILEGAYINQVHYIGSNEYQPLNDVVATDLHTGEDLTSEVKLVGSVVSTRPGKYSFTIEVTNSANVTNSVAVMLTVKSQVDMPEEFDLSGYSAQNPLKITLWHANGSSIEAQLKQYALDFEAKYDNVIKVDVIKKESNYSTLKDTVVKAISTENIPNIVQTYPDHVMEYLSYGRVLSVSPYMHHPVHGYSTTDTKDSFADILPIYRMENSQYTAEGDFFALPFNKSTEVMAYNKTVYDRLVAKGKAPAQFPETWQDLFDIAQAYKDEADSYFNEIAALVNAKGGENDKSYYTAENIALMKQKFVPYSYDSSDNAFITLTKQWGGEYTGIDEHRKGQILFNNDTTKGMLEYFRANNDKINVPGNWGDSYDYASDIFKYGFTFVTVGSTGGIRYNTPITVDGKPLFEVGIVPMLYNKEMPENRTVIQQGTNMTLLDVGTDMQKLASWYFLKYLTSYEVQLDFSTKIGYSPVRTSVYSDPKFVQFTSGKDENGNALGIGDLMMSMGLNAANLQRHVQFYDQAFIGSSTSRAAVGVAFNQVMLSTNANVINIALQQAYDEATKILG